MTDSHQPLSQCCKAPVYQSALYIKTSLEPYWICKACGAHCDILPSAGEGSLAATCDPPSPADQLPDSPAQSERETALMQTIASQKQTHDALLKKLDNAHSRIAELESDATYAQSEQLSEEVKKFVERNGLFVSHTGYDKEITCETVLMFVAYEIDRACKSRDARIERLRDGLTMKDCPWAEDIFSPLDEEEKGKILDAISQTNVFGTPDRVSAWLMRTAWNLIKKGADGTLAADDAAASPHPHS